MMSLRGAERRGNLFLRDGLLRYAHNDGKHSSDSKYLSLRATKSRGNPFLILITLLIMCFTPCQATIGFDGVNDFISINHNSLQNLSPSGHTVSIWVKINGGTGTVRDLISKDGEAAGTREWLITGSSTNRFRAHVWSNADSVIFIDSNLTITNGIWYHIAQTWDGINLILYINGIEDIRIPAAITGKNTSQPVRIGGGAQLGSPQYNSPCNIEDARIYNRPLSPTEVQALYNSRSKRPSGSLLNGLIGHYEMDDSQIGAIAAQAQDSSVYMNHGQFIEFDNLTTALSKDIPIQIETGNSLEFDGINSYININDSTSLKPNNLTISSWIKLNNNVTGGSVKAIIAKLSSFQGYQLIVLGSAIGGQSNELRFDYGDGSSYLALDTNESLITNTWYHIAATLSGNNGEIFVNSISRGTKSIAGNINYGTQVLKIGDGVDSSSRDWDGLIDDIRIYNKALSASEISYLHNGSGLDPGTSNLQALWTFDDDSAVKDSSGNNNHGVGIGGDSLKYTEGVLRR